MWALSLIRKYRAKRLAYIDTQSFWGASSPCPEALYDAGSAYLNGKMYVFGGYNSVNKVNSKIFIYDCAEDTWHNLANIPSEFPQSHCAICSDNVRFIYLAGGQIGAQCAPAVSNVLGYDTLKNNWFSLPQLPEARYAGTLQFIDGILYYVGGAKEDRHTPASNLWSLNIGKDLHWNELPSCPLPAMHRGSLSIDSDLYVFGGQQGDFQPLGKSKGNLCTSATQEIYREEVYKYSTKTKKWDSLPSMPIPVSHIDFSVLYDDNFIYVLGGQLYKHPYRYWLRIGNHIQRFDIKNSCWDIAGALPYRVKVINACIHKGKIIFTVGQRDVSLTSDRTGLIANKTFSAEVLNLNSVPNNKLNQEFLGKQFLLLTHEISLTGAPLVLLELAIFLRERGGMVRIVSLADDVKPVNVFLENNFAVLPLDYLNEFAIKSDLIIANTAFCGPWIRSILFLNPGLSKKILWWIHENDFQTYGNLFLDSSKVKHVVFDSENQKNTWIPEYLSIEVNTQVIYPCIRTTLELNKDNQTPLRRADLGISLSDIVILTVGTFAEIKGQDLLLKAISKMPNNDKIKVLIVGFQNKKQIRNYYKSLTKEERKVINKGKLLLLSQKNLQSFYSFADIYVTNSQYYGEPFGMATIEAMFFELPVLATRAGGSLEIIEEGKSGLFHDVGNSGIEELQQNILSLASNALLRAKLGRHGRVIVSNKFTKDKMHEKFITLIQGLLYDSSEG